MENIWNEHLVLILLLSCGAKPHETSTRWPVSYLRRVTQLKITYKYVMNLKTHIHAKKCKNKILFILQFETQIAQIDRCDCGPSTLLRAADLVTFVQWTLRRSLHRHKRWYLCACVGVCVCMCANARVRKYLLSSKYVKIPRNKAFYGNLSPVSACMYICMYICM